MNNSRSSPNTLRRAALAIVLINLAINIVHGMAHSRLSIFMSDWQNVYILVVILAAPIISLFFLKRRPRVGFALLLLSMLGSLLFGGYYHFIAAGADNVASLPEHSWSMPFQLTAILIALTETAGAIIGLLGLRSEPDVNALPRP